MKMPRFTRSHRAAIFALCFLAWKCALCQDVPAAPAPSLPNDLGTGLAPTIAPVQDANLAEEILPPPDCVSFVAVPNLTVGVVQSVDYPFNVAFSGGSVRLDTFEGAMTQQLCNGLCVTCNFVVLAGLASRITSLENGEVDFVVSRMTVTPERMEQVDFVQPYYYATGARLAVREGLNVTSWEDLAAKKISTCTLQGYYALPFIDELYPGINWKFVNNSVQMYGALSAGDCRAAVENSVNSMPPSLVTPEDAALLLPLPFGIAVQKGNKPLRLLLGGSLVKLMNQGPNSELLQIQNQFLDSLDPLCYLNNTVASISSFGIEGQEYCDSENFKGALNLPGNDVSVASVPIPSPA